MEVQTTHKFRDEWLAKALIDHQILDDNLYQELLFRFSEEEYFIDVLTENDYLSMSEIALFIKDVLQIATINLDQVDIESDIIELVPEELCHRFELMPFSMSSGNVINIGQV